MTYSSSKNARNEIDNARRTLDCLTMEEQRALFGRDLDEGSQDEKIRFEEPE